MTRNFVDDDHIRQVISDGGISTLDQKVSSLAEQHLLTSFPVRNWSTIVDWNKVPSRTTLHWNQASDAETVDWAKSTLAAKNAFVVLLFTAQQPCLYGSIDLMIQKLDELIWKAPGSRLLFGVECTGQGEFVFGPGIIEYDGRGNLIATTDVQSE